MAASIRTITKALVSPYQISAYSSSDVRQQCAQPTTYIAWQSANQPAAEQEFPRVGEARRVLGSYTGNQNHHSDTEDTMLTIPQTQPGREASTQRRPRRWRRTLLSGLLLLPVLAVVLVGGVYVRALAVLPAVEAAPVTAATTRFDGRYLVAASDADMVGTAYADGRLLQVPGDSDTLSLIELPLTDNTARVVEVPASNSVTSWPQIIAVAPAGNTIYVVETAGQVDDTIAQLPSDELPTGRVLTVVDLRDGVAAARTVDVGVGPAHVAISADGRYLAVGLREEGRQLAILPTATIDDPATFQYVAITRADGQPADEVTSVFWHPSGQFLGVGISAEEIQFYRVDTANGNIAVEPHGERIDGGYTLSYGQFTRDGRFYLTSEVNWDRYPPPLRNLINPPSEMVVIGFDASDAAQHTVVARVPVGLSAEGFAVSPQEDLVVAVNMNRTYLPDALAFWPGARLNSLTLLGFDRATGALTVLGEPYGFEGVLPEDAIFDSDGDALGVVIYNQRERPMEPGLIEFWNVVRAEGTARLERTAVQLEVVRGAHALNLLP
jgi:DNA-binding beta-propeller fold protein YncE